MPDQDDDIELPNLPLSGNWKAETLPPPPGREHEPDPAESDERLKELLYSTYDECILWRRCYLAGSFDNKASYFGGRPHLSSHLSWPTISDGSGSMMFLAQISLKAVPDFSLRKHLPADGALFFFVDSGCNGKVLYHPNGPALLQHALPSDVKSVYRDWYPASCECVDRQQLNNCRYHAEFPQFFVEPIVFRTFADSHPGHPWGETGERYQRLWRKEQSREIIGKLGRPHSRWWESGFDYIKRQDGALVPYTHNTKVQPAPEQYGIKPRIGYEPWLPDEGWPYSWVFVDIFTDIAQVALERFEATPSVGR